MRIHAPNSDFSGRVGADTFVDGVCNNPTITQLEYYHRQGYTVDLSDTDANTDDPVGRTVDDEPDTGTDPTDSAPGEPVVDAEPPAGNASAKAWAEFLESRGIEVPEGAKRAELKDLWELHADTDLTEEADDAEVAD
ncbi:hypothetical protein ACFORJ_07855 [Corynebacterium hansenii]|uniref:HeH/LEM domain-containing protein n=1 Tax=Corynebacterium hansenii TaxID=394964 RepID=A0ABV7ZQN0_9CORY|nr:hypothetical protein [Corynebacterium hansenii]WJZ00663.1 hypothetical protein CHAN_10310 [Corynebacterium hansenii]